MMLFQLLFVLFVIKEYSAGICTTSDHHRDDNSIQILKCYDFPLNVEKLLSKNFTGQYQLHFRSGNIPTVHSSTLDIYDRYNIQVMHIQNCLLSEIEPGAFRALKNLEDLSLSNNNLAEIRTGVFNYLSNLTTLDLSYNQIDLIESASFEGMRSLKVMDLSNNKLELLPNFVFRRLKNLTYLDISSNAIRELNADDFKKLFYLENLNLSRNSLKFINENTFSDLVGLVDLSLQNNKISFIDRNCFRNLQRLIQLDLSGNVLTQLEFGTFTGLNSLRYLNISYNNLAVIDFHYSLSKLQTLAITNNNISSIDIRSVKRYCPDLKLFSLDDNPLECTTLANVYGDIRNITIPGYARGPNVNGIACKLDASSKSEVQNASGKLPAVDNSELVAELKLTRKQMLSYLNLYGLLKNNAEQNSNQQIDDGDKFEKWLEGSIDIDMGLNDLLSKNIVIV